MRPEDLVQFVAWAAGRQGTVLGRMRLVKFLYLADLAYARTHDGRTFTGWPWRFVHFGPFCGEAADAIDAAAKAGLIAAVPYAGRLGTDDRFAYRYEDEEDPPRERQPPVEVAGFVRSMIKRFGDDTADLLDHVYFETEPMRAARPGSLLDFGTACAPARDVPIQMIKLSSSVVRRGRELLRAMQEHDAAPDFRAAAGAQFLDPDDADLQAALNAMDGEGLGEGSGTALVDPTSSEGEDG